MQISSNGSLIDPFIKRVRNNPGETAVIFMADDGSEQEITMGQLHSDALRYANVLNEKGIKPRDIVILALGHSRALIAAFWGTLYQGAVPSIFPYNFPRPGQEVLKRQILSIVKSSGARCVLTTEELETSSLSESKCTFVNPNRIPAGMNGGERCLPGLDSTGEQMAYLQYTSGTTGAKKGVVLSHRAILNFVSAFARDVEIQHRDISVNWLPLYHDYGLFAGFVLPLVIGVLAVMMSPFRWVRNPKNLLWAIHKHRGSLCWMPNSAFNHTRLSVRDKDLTGLDLSCVRVLCSGGEIARHDTLKAFLECFSSYGLKPAAIGAGYGMAENTMAVTIASPTKMDWVNPRAIQKLNRAIPGEPHKPNSAPVVSCGKPISGAEIVILDDTGKKLPERCIGEIVIRSNTLFSGYHRNPDLTARVMRDGWYFTGDMGYLADGHLYPCGRKRDLIIVGGKNIHPEDLETIAVSIPGVYPDRAVAFGVADERLGSEKVVMVCDLKPPSDDDKKLRIERELRKRVFQELDIRLGGVHLMEKKWVVKTRNGKIARGANREKFLAWNKNNA